MSIATSQRARARLEVYFPGVGRGELPEGESVSISGQSHGYNDTSIVIHASAETQERALELVRQAAERIYDEAVRR